MLYFFYGEEEFLIQEKIRELLGGQKPQSFDLAEDLDESQLVNVLTGGNLFGNFPVTILNPSEYAGNLDFETILKNSGEQKIIFYEFIKPKKSATLVKYLLKNAQTQGFSSLKFYDLRNWIRQRFSHYKGRATSEQIEQISIISGGDLALADKLIEKLSLYYLNQENWQADGEAFENLVGQDVAGTIFNLIEAIAEHQTKKAYSLLHKLTSAGENELYILSMIAYQFRKLLLTRSMLDRSKARSEIASEAGIPPFALARTLETARKYSMEKLKKIYGKLLDAEISIKTGRTDPATLLDLLVLALAK